MSQKDEKVVNFAIQDFTQRVRTVERISLAAQLIAACELIPEELRTQGRDLCAKMVETLDN